MVTGTGRDQEAFVRVCGGGDLGHDPDPGVVTLPAHQLLLLDQGVDLRRGALSSHHHGVIGQEHETIGSSLERSLVN